MAKYFKGHKEATFMVFKAFILLFTPVVAEQLVDFEADTSKFATTSENHKLCTK